MGSFAELMRLFVLLLLIVVAYRLRAEDAPYEPFIHPASDDAEIAIKRFQIPKGFQVELVAAEPMLANPVAFCIDAKGDFFVAETFRIHDGVSDNRRHMEWLVDDLASRSVADRIRYHEKWIKEIDDWKVHHDRVRMLADTNDDGVVDRSTVFADGFHRLEDGIASGVLAYQGNVYFACIPDLWLLRDETGDGKADLRKSLQTGYGVRTSFIGHDLHGLALGPDGKLYFSIGDRGMNVPTPDGPLEAIDYGAVIRCHLDGSHPEIVHIGLRNPQELAFNEVGDLFTGDNNSDSGDRARLVRIVEGGDSGWRMPYQYVEAPIARGPWNGERIWQPANDSQPAAIVPPIINFADGPSGLAFNPGVGLPKEYDRNFFLADFRAGAAISGIRNFRLEPKGANYEVADEGVFIWRIVATDIEFGWDGAIYLLDWVEGWEKPNKGRIYRFFQPETRPEGAASAAIVTSDWSKMPVDRLRELLAHRDMRIRLRAQFALAERPSEGRAILDGVARTGSDRLSRLHAIWGLGQIGVQDTSVADTLVALLADPEAEVRAQSAKTLGNAHLAAGASRLIELLRDPEPRVRFFAATALGQLESAEAAEAIVAMIDANADGDPYLRHAGVYALAQGKNASVVRSALGSDRSIPVRRAGLVVLRRWKSPELREFLGSDQPAVLVEEAARAIYDEPMLDLIPAVAPLLTRTDLSPMTRRRALFASVRSGKPEDARRVADLLANGREPADLRQQALAALAMWDAPPLLDPVDGDYRPMPERPKGAAAAEFARVAAAVLATPDKDLRTQAIQQAGRFQTREVESQLVELFQNTKELARDRVEALAALGAMQVPELATLVKEGLADERATVQAEARHQLARLDPAGAVAALSSVLDHQGWSDQQAALRTLADIEGPEADALLVRWLDKLGRGEVPPEIRLDLRLAANKRSTGAAPQKAREIEAKRSAESDPVARFHDALAGGDVSHGKEVFFKSTAAACLRCHKIDGEGGEVGPDLSKIAEQNDRRALLEALVDPNRKIARGFDSVVLALADGTVVTGVLRDEDDARILVIDAEGKKIDVPKEEIEERRQGKSAMPEDVITKISEADLRDLVEFLSTRK